MILVLTFAGCRVVQELAVSSQAIIRYGSVQAPWTMFVTAATAIQSLHAPLSPESTKVLDYFARLVNTFENLRVQLHSKAASAPLLSLLRAFNTRQATDERDKVFALLGLALPQQRSIVNTQYYSDVPDVYLKTALALIQDPSTSGLWAGDLGRKSREDLPSWVPDWNAVFVEADLRRMGVEQLYDSCGPFRTTVLHSHDDNSEFVRLGMQELLTSLQNFDEHSNQRLPDWLGEALNAYIQFCQSHLQLVSEEGRVLRVKALCEALIPYCTINYSATGWACPGLGSFFVVPSFSQVYLSQSRECLR